MKSHRILSRLGPRLFLSYVLASLAAAASGLAAAFLVPANTYNALMLRVMNPPTGATVRQMDATLAAAIARAVSLHVVLSLAIAIGVSIVIAGYVSRQISLALGRMTDAARLLAKGDFAGRVPLHDIQEISDLGQDINTLAASLQESEHRRSLAIASVGHELRTPVTALRAYCDGIREGILDLHGRRPLGAGSIRGRRARRADGNRRLGLGHASGEL
ncbi:MAG: HAMP domain-containing protein [Thermaerobacter sp.]|nr:HAMP domain-containing protein [Thermaerobacter sp.]